MIGQRVTGTIWVVSWRYMAPVDGATAHTAPVQGRQIVITADPSGADLLEVTKMVILGAKAVPEHEFTILISERSADIAGLAQLPIEDGGWPAHFSAGKALLELAGRQAAASHDLTKRLQLEQEVRVSSAGELNALRQLANVVAADPRCAMQFADLLENAKAARAHVAELDWMATQVSAGR